MDKKSKKLKTNKKTRKSYSMEIFITLVVFALMLMVLLVVMPALQRNSQNQQRRQDIKTLQEKLSQYEKDNEDSLPSLVDFNEQILSSIELKYYAPGHTTNDGTLINPQNDGQFAGSQIAIGDNKNEKRKQILYINDNQDIFIKDNSYIGQSELHIFAGRTCVTNKLDDAQYTKDLVPQIAQTTDLAFIYRLAGKQSANCDNY